MLVPQSDITRYLPHRNPFLMVDNLLSATPERFESDFYIAEDNVLLEGGIFQESGLIENIAQTCAVSFGYLDAGDGPAKMGFIGAISKVEVFALPPFGSTIQTVVTPLHQLGNIYLVKGESYLEGRILLGCEMKIVVAE